MLSFRPVLSTLDTTQHDCERKLEIKYADHRLHDLKMLEEEGNATLCDGGNGVRLEWEVGSICLAKSKQIQHESKKSD